MIKRDIFAVISDKVLQDTTFNTLLLEESSSTTKGQCTSKPGDWVEQLHE